MVAVFARAAIRNACKPEGIEAKLGISVEQSGRAMPIAVELPTARGRTT